MSLNQFKANIRSYERRINEAGNDWSGGKSTNATEDKANPAALYVVDTSGTPVATVELDEGATGADTDRAIAKRFGAGYTVSTNPPALTIRQRLNEAIAESQGISIEAAAGANDRAGGRLSSLPVIFVEKGAGGSSGAEGASGGNTTIQEIRRGIAELNRGIEENNRALERLALKEPGIR